MKNLLMIIFGSTSIDTPTVKYLPIQTEGVEADAARARRDAKVKEVIARMGKQYRLYPRVEHGTHRLIDPKSEQVETELLVLRSGHQTPAAYKSTVQQFRRRKGSV